MPDDTEEDSGPKLTVMEGRKSARPGSEEPPLPLPARRIRIVAIPCYWCAAPETYMHVPVYVQPQTVAENSPVAQTWVRNWQVKIQGHCWKCNTAWIQDLLVSVPPGSDHLSKSLTPNEYNLLMRGNDGPGNINNPPGA